MPEIFQELNALQDKLEKHYHDMQDMEFTVQEGKLGSCRRATVSARVRPW